MDVLFPVLWVAVITRSLHVAFNGFHLKAAENVLMERWQRAGRFRTTGGGGGRAKGMETEGLLKPSRLSAVTKALPIARAIFAPLLAACPRIPSGRT